MDSQKDSHRLLLYLNGVLAIRTQPMSESERAVRAENWKRVYGNVKIEVTE